MICPIPNHRGFCRPEGTGANGVMLLGEALGDAEADEGLPFRPGAPAGSVLERAIRRLGMNREQFVLWNTVPVQPPKNYLEGAPWEAEAIAWGRPYLEEVIAKYKPRCIVALGGVPTKATTGLAGRHLGVSYLTGFVLPSLHGIPVVPCFHPSFLRRGAMGLFGVLMRAIRLATQVVREGRQPILPPVENPPEGYILYPNESRATDFLYDTLEGQGILAYDIETPWSTNEDEAEEAEGVQAMKSIQFSLGLNTGIFLPWREPFIPIAKKILASPIRKMGYNNWRFDDPVLRSNGCVINGESHDLMWMWHHLNPDVPRGLQFVAAQSGWPWPWKNMDSQFPEFYGIVDTDVLHFLL